MVNADFISTHQSAEKWVISSRRVQQLCEHERITGAIRFSRAWAIPKGSPKPQDPRLKPDKEKKGVYYEYNFNTGR